MDALECIMSRRSIRKFLPEPVPEETLRSVIETAKWSPSYKNSQPWEVVLVSGKKKEELSNLLIGLLQQGRLPAPDLPEPGPWPPEIEKKISEHMRMRCEALGIDLTDPETGRRAKVANFKFYGAPHGLFLFQDGRLSLWSLLDMGMFAQSLMLSAWAHGLGTVPQGFLTDYSAEVKKFLGIHETKRLVLGISIGYPDLKDRANLYRSQRQALGDILRLA